MYIYIYIHSIYIYIYKEYPLADISKVYPLVNVDSLRTFAHPHRQINEPRLTGRNGQKFPEGKATDLDAGLSGKGSTELGLIYHDISNQI